MMKLKFLYCSPFDGKHKNVKEVGRFTKAYQETGNQVSYKEYSVG